MKSHSAETNYHGTLGPEVRKLTESLQARAIAALELWTRETVLIRGRQHVDTNRLP